MSGWPKLGNFLTSAAQRLVGFVDPGGNEVLLPQIVAQSGSVVLIAPNGSSNATGQITLGTALLTQPVGTVLVYLPSGVVTGGSQGTGAGLYAATFSSTTVCQLTGTGIVTANTTYTQTTGSSVALFSVTVPGGLLGPSGALRLTAEFTCNNSAGTKFPSATLGGVTIMSGVAGGLMSTFPFARIMTMLRNRGAQNANVVNPYIGIGTSGSATTYSTIDTSVAQTLVISGQLVNTATDYLMLEGFVLEALPGA